MKSQKFSFYRSADDTQTIEHLGLSPATHPITLSDKVGKSDDVTAHQFLKYLLATDSISAVTKKNIENLLLQAQGKISPKSLVELLSKCIENDIPQPLQVSASIDGTSMQIPVTIQHDEKKLDSVITNAGFDLLFLRKSGLIGLALQGITPPELVPYVIDQNLRKELQGLQGNAPEKETYKRILGNIVTRALAVLDERAPTLQDWTHALLECPDADFMMNLSVFAHGRIYSGSVTEDLMKFDDQVVLRYHELNSGAYRGEQTGGNLWVGSAESTIKCGVCKHAISGPQNRVRDAGFELHASCVKKHLEGKARAWNIHDTYMARVYSALFPDFEKITPCGK